MFPDISHGERPPKKTAQRELRSLTEDSIQQKFQGFWRVVASALKDSAGVLGYDLVNAPRHLKGPLAFGVGWENLGMFFAPKE